MQATSEIRSYAALSFLATVLILSSPFVPVFRRSENPQDLKIRYTFMKQRRILRSAGLRGGKKVKENLMGGTKKDLRPDWNCVRPPARLRFGFSWSNTTNNSRGNRFRRK
ncbi:Hypothetical protein NTJ_06357 [Nesidiocoris tenuis]|uniref:Uncharacterized protein n=1 Tax=Nesidiocoris tenuis TaxID=355587 RepID=A0ABN7ANL0_9HEMI|nr:Hypothetical protein NTJ_06357 [Nesidiocoris tenuis]